MARLPTVGGDDGTWGTVLNEYLEIEHDSGGFLKTTGSLATKVEVTGGGKETVSTNATSGSAATLNLDNGNVFDVTLTDNCTFTFSGTTSSKACSFTLVLRQDGTGSRTATWPAAVKWASDIAPTLSTAASAIDVLTFFTIDNGTTWFGFIAGLNMS